MTIRTVGGAERGTEPTASPQLASREEPKPSVAEPRRVAIGSAFVINKAGELLD
jgi:hypothetical protein